jgi:hypothetical protein
VAQLAINNIIFSIGNQAKTQRSVKIDISSKFNDRINPTFDFWYLAMTSKFKMNTDHFENKKARKYQVYIYIKEITSDYFYSRYEPDAVDPFQTA